MYSMEHYSALKRKEILTQTIAWMNLKVIMLGKINQSQKNNYFIILLV